MLESGTLRKVAVVLIVMVAGSPPDPDLWLHVIYHSLVFIFPVFLQLSGLDEGKMSQKMTKSHFIELEK